MIVKEIVSKTPHVTYTTINQKIVQKKDKQPKIEGKIKKVLGGRMQNKQIVKSSKLSVKIKEPEFAEYKPIYFKSHYEHEKEKLFRI